MGPDGKAGELTSKIKGWVGDIMYGNTPDHPWAIVINEKGAQ